MQVWKIAPSPLAEKLNETRSPKRASPKTPESIFHDAFHSRARSAAVNSAAASLRAKAAYPNFQEGNPAGRPVVAGFALPARKLVYRVQI
jgi:hypothetical protein